MFEGNSRHDAAFAMNQLCQKLEKTKQFVWLHWIVAFMCPVTNARWVEMEQNGLDVAINFILRIRHFFEQDCGLKLSTEAEGKGCYPLDDHILCKNCNARRVQTLTSGIQKS